MTAEKRKGALRFYYLTDENAPAVSPVKQVEAAVRAGATLVQYRHKSFSAALFEEVAAIRDFCRCNRVPFVVNDNILLAKAVGADGVHLGQDDEPPALARRILGPGALVGISVSSLDELAWTDLGPCDYIGTGPVFATRTKTDAKPACGLDGLAAVVKASPLPVVAIGGIDAGNAGACFQHGAAGVAVISAISRAEDPRASADRLAAVCGCRSRGILFSPWQDEFRLIARLLETANAGRERQPGLKVPAGDDACLLDAIDRPVISTDTQKEGVHFRLDWQTPEEIGRKAVEVTFSDLAASFARPVGLFVNLALPACTADETAEALYRGIGHVLSRHGGVLGGGNISRAGELSLDLFAIGRGDAHIFPTRAAARPGDGLYASGPLGLARAGLDALVRKAPGVEFLVEKFKRPAARFDAAGVLAGHGVSCVMDISDGLAGDAAHIAAASGVTVVFELNSRDFDPVLVEYCRRYGLSPAEMVISGGEDYELLFACPPETFGQLRKDLPGAFRVGRCLEFSGVPLLNLPAGIASFQHGQP